MLGPLQGRTSSHNVHLRTKRAHLLLLLPHHNIQGTPPHSLLSPNSHPRAQHTHQLRCAKTASLRQSCLPAARQPGTHSTTAIVHAWLLTTAAAARRCTHTYPSAGRAWLLPLPLPLPLLLALLLLPSAPTAPVRGHCMSAVSAAAPPSRSHSCICSLVMNLRQHSHQRKQQQQQSIRPSYMHT
jgi:hypothetical protein